VAFIGDENASRAPANLEWMEQRMPERRRFTPMQRKQRSCASRRKVPPLDVERGLLVRKACRAETASHTIEWLASDRKHLGEIN